MLPAGNRSAICRTIRQPALLFYYLFDLVIYRGEDLRQQLLSERRAMLETKIMGRLSDPIRLSELLVANQDELIELVRSNGLEGLIAKRTDSVYESGKRSGRWVKLRVNRSQEFVIGGYVPNSGSFDSIAMILRCRRSGLCRASAQRIHTRIASHGLQTVPRARDR